MRDGLTTAERDRIKALERENRQLRQTNEILRKAKNGVRLTYWRLNPVSGAFSASEPDSIFGEIYPTPFLGTRGHWSRSLILHCALAAEARFHHAA